MARLDRTDKGGRKRRKPPLPIEKAPIRGRDIIRREERLRISPKHPGMGRR